MSFVRYDLVSLVYLLAFILHLVSYGFQRSFKVRAILVQGLVVISVGVCLGRIVFHAVALSAKTGDYGEFGQSAINQLFGFLPISSVLLGFQQISPDVIVLILSLLLWRSRAFRPVSTSSTRSQGGANADVNISMDQAVRWRRTHRRDMIVCAFLILLMFLCLFIGMASMPSLISLPYQIFVGMELFAWATGLKLFGRLLRTIRQILLLYLIVDIILIYLAQISIIYTMIGQPTAAKIGLYPLWNPSMIVWQAILQAVMLLMAFLLIAGHSYLARRHDRNADKLLVAFAKDYQLHQLQHISIFRPNGRLIPRITKFFAHNSPKVCSIVRALYYHKMTFGKPLNSSAP